MKYRVIFAGFMSFFLSSLMSCWITWINLGWSSVFFEQWGAAFRMAWPVAAVIAFTLTPMTQRLTQRLLDILPK